MNTQTKKIKTPQSGIEIEIKDWITGEEAEYIEEALFEGIEVKPDIATRNVNINKFNTSAIKKQFHREVEKFIVAVGDQKDNILKAVQSLPEADYLFIKEEISKRRENKKKE